MAAATRSSPLEVPETSVGDGAQVSWEDARRGMWVAPSVSMESLLVLCFWLLQLLPWRNIVERYLQDLAVSLYIMIDAIALNFGCTR